MRNWILAGAFGLSAAIMAGGAAQAAACDPGKPGSDLTADEAQKVYDCLKAELHAGYKKGPKQWIPSEFVEKFDQWTLASTHPAAPGFHGNRFLVTYVNKIGEEEYLKYDGSDAPIPAGTLLAKTSFKVTDSGKVRKGPLFLMQKVEKGASPETMDWYYMAVAPSGAPMAVPVMTACNECHVENFGEQRGLGYPVEEARVK